MSLTVKELLNAVQTSEDFQKRGAMSRRFLVTTRDHKAARLADGVPGIRTAHPDDPAYILDNISTSASGSGHTYVDCAYSNDRRFYAREVDRDAPTWYHWGWGSRDAEVTYYINVKQKTWFSDQSSPVDLWELVPSKLLESRLVRPLFVRLEKVSDIRWLDPIRVQKNRVHLMPDGVKYRFLGGDVSQKDDSTYDVKYEWELDEGTLYPVTDYTLDRVRMPLRGNSPAVGIMRPEYSRIQPLSSPDPLTEPHKIFVTKEYVEDLDGWRTLPGANRVI